MKPSR